MRTLNMCMLVLACLAAGTEAYGGGGRFRPAQCPGFLAATPPAQMDSVPSLSDFNEAVKALDIEAVLDDIVRLLTRSESCWPADSFRTSLIGASYGGLFVRLAWHCSGSYRSTDGVGGCAGGRLRFDPEASWPDNVNLDKARSLLWPIKRKYGDALSWGDLFVLAGTGAILHMGGPVTEVCVGRVDDSNGIASAPLGPGPEAPACPMQGNCPAPIGAAEIGLIYVNAQGFMGNPRNLTGTAAHIRDIFGRMGMDDVSTVALIGGGHAFGKSHGACELGAGPPPNVQPFNPWPGNCGTGRGRDTVSSGIEGQWTTDPLKWDNEYFQLLQKYGPTYRLETGPGGAFQWFTPARPELMMQTTDLSLVHDAKFKAIVNDFANDLSKLDAAFAKAWETLVTNGGGFAEARKCISPKFGRFTAPVLVKYFESLKSGTN